MYKTRAMSADPRGALRRPQWGEWADDAESAAYVEGYLRASAEVFSRIPVAETARLIDILRRARDERRHVFICGNGGSASTASHFAAGLGKEGSPRDDLRFRALALADNTAWLTSLANDSDYSLVFTEQLKNFAEAGDVLIAFSGSGNSSNVIHAVEWANDNGLLTVGVTGRCGGLLASAAHHAVCIASDHIGHVEDAHFLIQHLLTYYFIEPAARTVEGRNGRSRL